MANAGGTPTDSIGGLASPTLAMIDGSTPPKVYLTGTGGVAGRIEPRTITATPQFGAVPFSLPDLPASISLAEVQIIGLVLALGGTLIALLRPTWQPAGRPTSVSALSRATIRAI